MRGRLIVLGVFTCVVALLIARDLEDIFVEEFTRRFTR